MESISLWRILSYICVYVCITYIIKPMDGVLRKHMMFSLASLILPIPANQTGVNFLNFKYQFRWRSILLNNNCHVIPLLDDVFVLNVPNNACYSQFLPRDDLMSTWTSRQLSIANNKSVTPRQCKIRWLWWHDNPTKGHIKLWSGSWPRCQSSDPIQALQ